MSKAVITSIELTNVKSYENETVCFSPGINVIGGLNGAGKSTIFESIGHCLFGVDAGKFIGNSDNFTRKGTQSYSINVFFTGTDGQNYKISRDKKGNRTLFIDSPKGWFPAGDSSIDETIRRLTGVTASLPLDKMFNEIIGPFQSDFLTPFTLTPAKRNTHFDEILGINQWKDLSSKIAPVAKMFEMKIKSLQDEIERLEQETAELPEKRTILTDKINSKTALEQKYKLLHEEAEKLQTRIDELVSTEKKLNSKNREKNEAKAKCDKLIVELEKDTALLNNARESLSITNQNETGYRIYEEQSTLRKSVENKIREKNELNARIAKLEGDIKSSETAISTKRTAISTSKAKNLAEEEMIIRSVEQLVKDQEEITGKVNQSKENLDKIIGQQKQIRDFDFGIIMRASESAISLYERIRQFEKSVNTRQAKLSGKEETRKQSDKLDKLNKDHEEIISEISSCKAQLKNAKSGKETLKEGLCPYMGEKCLNLGVRKPGEFFDEEISKLTTHIKKLEKTQKEISQLINAALDSRQLLSALEQEEKELAKENAGIQDLTIQIQTILPLTEIIDLCSRFSHIVSCTDDKNCGEILKNLSKQVSEFAFPEDIADYPESLKKLNSLFAKALSDVLSIVAEKENSARKLLDENNATASTVKTRISEQENRRKTVSTELTKMEKDLKKLDKDESKLETEKTVLKNEKSKLSGFADVENELLKTDQILEQHKSAHTLYNQHIKNAQSTAGLAENVVRITEESEKASVLFNRIKQETDELEKLFDSNELDEKRTRIISVVAEREGSKVAIEAFAKEIDSVRKEIEKMENTLKKAAVRRQEAAEYGESARYTDILRQSVLTKIAPKVASCLRAEISSIAKDIYREISGIDEILNWGENYQVELIDYYQHKNDQPASGNTRVRTDRQLSGGQLMTAVIALRLALLMKIGSSIAFFDEPTSNLDEERRKKLAETFRNLKTNWYSQLFLVSHDESFQGITGNYIELLLEEGKTTVISGPGIKSSFYNIKVTV
ncbi:MAG: SMC family ATPase [Firmicutes bacterium]|nr:SMC family ATPase [Bacillota bacterium]